MLAHCCRLIFWVLAWALNRHLAMQLRVIDPERPLQSCLADDSRQQAIDPIVVGRRHHHAETGMVDCTPTRVYDNLVFDPIDSQGDLSSLNWSFIVRWRTAGQAQQLLTCAQVHTGDWRWDPDSKTPGGHACQAAKLDSPGFDEMSGGILTGWDVSQKENGLLSPGFDSPLKSPRG